MPKLWIIEFDKIFGLDLINLVQKMGEIPKEIIEKNEKREQERANKNFEQADFLRKEIENAGFNVYDKAEGSTLERKLSSLA